ncbi:MAG: right-handed parallel beta-helix repeat-containing protein [Planctomycetota bacterium]
MKHALLFCLALLFIPLFSSDADAGDVIVRDTLSLRIAIRDLKPDQVIKIAPGVYSGNNYVNNAERVTFEALVPTDKPVIQGGATGLQFVRCNNLTLRNLKFQGQTDNGLNLDDGGQFDRPVVGITLENIEVNDVGPKGNFDGIKCSGLDNLVIRNCTVNGWGGDGIDMVGCHNALITGCKFIAKTGFSTTTGVQVKGGSSDIIIENGQFTNISERPINVGGITDLNMFRPSGAKYEARRITVRGNTFTGAPCATAFVGVDGAEFTNNTILFPTKWIFRILQENTAPGMVPCRNVLIKNNKIVFLRSQVQTEVNIGAGTEPKTFRFEGNRWFAQDKPSASKPSLPTVEIGGTYGIDPRK